jgi:hypothetical protein
MDFSFHRQDVLETSASCAEMWILRQFRQWKKSKWISATTHLSELTVAKKDQNKRLIASRVGAIDSRNQDSLDSVECQRETKPDREHS